MKRLIHSLTFRTSPNLYFFLTRWIPPIQRVLFVESGGRDVLSRFLPLFRQKTRDRVVIDLVTCYDGFPEGFQHERARVYRVSDYTTGATRRALVAELRANRYDAVGIICSGEPIMTKWKWALAARVPAKVFIVNENSDHFWLDRTNWRIIRHFIVFRAGLSGADFVPAVTRLLLFPFLLLYLVVYAAAMHARRRLRHP